MKFEFLNRLSKNTQTQNVMKIRSVGAELFHADGRRDVTKTTVALRNFAKASNRYPSCCCEAASWYLS